MFQGFFRRSIQQKINYRACTRTEDCLILRNNRNRCQCCRLKKCLAVGMSRDGNLFSFLSRTGRANGRNWNWNWDSLRQRNITKRSTVLILFQLSDLAVCQNEKRRECSRRCRRPMFNRKGIRLLFNTRILETSCTRSTRRLPRCRRLWRSARRQCTRTSVRFLPTSLWFRWKLPLTSPTRFRLFWESIKHRECTCCRWIIRKTWNRSA